MLFTAAFDREHLFTFALTIILLQTSIIFSSNMVVNAIEIKLGWKVLVVLL